MRAASSPKEHHIQELLVANLAESCGCVELVLSLQRFEGLLLGHSTCSMTALVRQTCILSNDY